MDGDPALSLEVEFVHCPFLHGLVKRWSQTVAANSLQGRFAVVDVRNDGDVSNVVALVSYPFR